MTLKITGTRGLEEIFFERVGADVALTRFSFEIYDAIR